jgi:hypothetical protein
MRILAGVLFLAGLLCVASMSAAQPPGSKGGQKGGGKGFPGGKGGGFGGAVPFLPGQVMPPFMADRLKLTDDQKKQVETLQKDVDEKLAKILTEDQNKMLKEMKERPRGGGGRVGGPDRPRGKGDGRREPPPPPNE